MVRPTHDEIIRELTRELALLKERMDTVRGEIERLPQLTIQAALLQQRVDDLREGTRVWIQRIWMVLGPLVGGATGALLTYSLNVKK